MIFTEMSKEQYRNLYRLGFDLAYREKRAEGFALLRQLEELRFGVRNEA